MRKLILQIASLLFLAIMFKLSVSNYRSSNLPSQKHNQDITTSISKDKSGTSFAKPNSDLEVLQAP